MDRMQVLDMAKEKVKGENNFELIAKFWSTYKGVDFIAEDVAIMMALLKVARIKTGHNKEDSYVDLCGYASHGAEATSKKNEGIIRCKDCRYSTKCGDIYRCFGQKDAPQVSELSTCDRARTY